MTAPVFVDTNVLVYARDAAAGPKQAAALAWLEHLWQSREGRLSYQVLSEFYVTVTSKLRPGMPLEAARRDVRALSAWGPVVIDTDLIQGAWLIQDRYRLSWWDALIVSAAQTTGSGYLLSEDFQEGQELDGVRVISPFSSTPSALAR